MLCGDKIFWVGLKTVHVLIHAQQTAAACMYVYMQAAASHQRLIYLLVTVMLDDKLQKIT
jgi:hypothetical protein